MGCVCVCDVSLCVLCSVTEYVSCVCEWCECMYVYVMFLCMYGICVVFLYVYGICVCDVYTGGMCMCVCMCVQYVCV